MKIQFLKNGKTWGGAANAVQGVIKLCNDCSKNVFTHLGRYWAGEMCQETLIDCWCACKVITLFMITLSYMPMSQLTEGAWA